MIEPRIYRAAFVPAVLAVVLVMFSLQSRPAPLPQGLAADVVFEGASAATQTRQIVAAAPDRTAGSRGDRATARRVAADLRQRGFTVDADRFGAEGRDLVNVVGSRAGRTQRKIVVVADRDASGTPDAQGSAADTASLLQLARVFQGRPTTKTLVLASTDGGGLGEVGAARLATSLGDPALVDGVVVLSGMGWSGGGRPAVVAFSGDTARAGLRLQRTAAASLEQEDRPPASAVGFFGQVARLSFPFGIGAQAPLIDHGYEAVRLAGAGELGNTANTTPQSVDPDRIGALGRSALRTLSALDTSRRPASGRSTYVTAVSQVMPGWVIAVLALALIFPALVAVVDAFARARRRKLAVLPWLGWIAAPVLALLLAVGLAYLLEVTGAFSAPGGPVPPDRYPAGAGQYAILGVLVVVAAGAWFGARRLASALDPDFLAPAVPGAAVAVALVLVAATVALWFVNPFSALLMAPALHLWMLAVLVEPAAARRTRLAMLAGGLALPVLLVVYLLAVLGVGPLGGAWYLLLLVTGGHVTFASALLGCVFAALLGSLLAIVRGTPPAPAAPPREMPSVRGPSSYAGPGSLGGTSSALRR